MVKQYPQSFADVLRDGTQIGTGYGSLLTQIKTRVEHVNRGCMLSRRRKQKKDLKFTSRRHCPGPADQYGCVRWQSECPLEESEEILQEKKKRDERPLHFRGASWGRERTSQSVNEGNILPTTEIHQWLPSTIDC